eukprot:360276-Lingulodinium_polyedra.AAC.1
MPWPRAALWLRGDPREVSVRKASGRPRQKLGQMRQTCEGNQQEKHTSRAHSTMEMPPCLGRAATMPAPPTT